MNPRQLRRESQHFCSLLEDGRAKYAKGRNYDAVEKLRKALAVGAKKLPRFDDNSLVKAHALLELGLEPPFTYVLNTLVSLLREAGINTQDLEKLTLRQLSRMAVQSHYPMDATPASELFDQEDADQALTTAKQVLSIIQALDQQA